MKLTKKKEKIAENWIERNGACSFNFKERDIILHDGGLFSIEKKRMKVHKIVGYKKLKNGCSQIIFSKKKTHYVDDYEATLWFEELGETIRYLKSMQKMLEKIGYNTDPPLNKKFMEEVDLRFKKAKKLKDE